MLSLVGLLLASGCGLGTSPKVVEKPVRPQPCNINQFPTLPDVQPIGLDTDGDGEADKALLEAAELYALASWVEAVADYRDSVRACPWASESVLKDIPRELGPQ